MNYSAYLPTKFLTLLLLIGPYLSAQKLPIDSSVYNKWPSIDFNGPYGFHAITNDGHYFAYSVYNQPMNGHSAVIMGTNTSWKLEFLNSGLISFTADSRFAICKLPGDSLAIITLGTSSIQYMHHINSYALFSIHDEQWLLCQLNNSKKELLLENLVTKKKITLYGVVNYIFPDQKMSILLQREIREEKNTRLLQWLDISKDTLYTIWTGIDANNFVFHEHDFQIAFTAPDNSNGKTARECWYFKPGMPQATKLIPYDIPNIDSGWVLGHIRRFSNDGSRLFFTLKEKHFSRPLSTAVNVDVWNYKDEKMQAQQLNDLSPRSSEAFINIEQHKIINLLNENEVAVWTADSKSIKDQWMLIEHRNGKIGLGENNWNLSALGTEYLTSTLDGTRKSLVALEPFGPKDFTFSPQEKFVLFYETKRANWFSYELSTAKIRNITQNKVISGNDLAEKGTPFPPRPVIVGWLEGDSAVILHDQNDLWLVSLQASYQPINLTNGYGRKKHISFRLAMNDGHAVLCSHQKVILSAFDRITKNNGFYEITVGQKIKPELLSMGPYVYVAPGNYPDLAGQQPIKALQVNIFVVRRMSCLEAPNYFLTYDFKTFTPLSSVHPEKNYNWMTSELHSWKLPDGELCQGVLYKPENFDPHKKYPIIFHYYERLADRKNTYITPESSSGSLNITWYVSNGYLVFLPDIHYSIGETGKSALKSVVSAARYLSSKPWVDYRHMGIQGFSFGAYETNYILTHTNLFAAACSASGLADLVSHYGSIGGGGVSLQFMDEQGQNRIGEPLPKHPELYIENSPIFRVNKVTTPLLLMHTTNDEICPFANAIEFFTALRRMGKKVWLLQYDGNHGLLGKLGLDYNTRMQQFFEHYLKGYPSARWMSKGIPARLKGIDDGLELENK